MCKDNSTDARAAAMASDAWGSEEGSSPSDSRSGKYSNSSGAELHKVQRTDLFNIKRNTSQ